MSKLQKIFIKESMLKRYANVTDADMYELRFDWDNDWHQAIMLKSLNPEDVIKGLEDAINILKSETMTLKI